MKRHRAPNWRKWGVVPDVRIWEGVSLSLNVDPDSLDQEYSWKAEGRIFRESQEFQDRLFVVRRNLGRNEGLRPTAINMSDSADSSVRLSDLASFARSINWTVPAEFDALAPNRWQPSEGLFAGGITSIDCEFDPRIRSALDSDTSNRESSTGGEKRRVATLQKLVLAMAKAKYGWQPDDKRSKATGEKAGSIYVDVLKQLGERRRIDADTIRGVLEQANSEFPGRED
jgi:hypothetical protein